MMKVIVNMLVMMKKMPLSTLMFLKRHPGVCHAVCWCALLVWKIFCVELLLSGADLGHLVCNFTRSWLAIAALAFQTKSDGWIY